MDASYVYQKKRSEFGRQCLFTDKGPELVVNYMPEKHLVNNFILRDPVDRAAQWVPMQAGHILNTMRAEYVHGSMNHVEGGWPKDVNLQDEEQPKRYRRKIEKDDSYQHVLSQLCKSMESCILQNKAVNIYQQYFCDVEPSAAVERSRARTVNVYKDQSSPTRPASYLSWSPDRPSKLAVSHCDLTFQKDTPYSTHSYIWDIENPNTPLAVLRPEFASVCMEFHHKDASLMISGHLNGQVGVWDLRKGNEPMEFSLMENSFRDPVNSVLWINSKSGMEFFTASTDGQVKWWDMRKMDIPMEQLIVNNVPEDEQVVSKTYGVSRLEYESSIPTRFMLGCEQGVVWSCNRKGKTAMEKMVFQFPAHYGPVLALQRNPAFVKNFLTVGDWSAKIWSEDCRESAIIWTCFHRARLTDGAWSPTRYSVFMTTRSDGVLDCWDILQQQKQATLSVQVCDEPLRCIRAHDMGRLVAVANQNGTTYLVEFSENLSSSSKNDKALLTSMFEREGKREKILEARNRELKLKLRTKAQAEEAAALAAAQAAAEGIPIEEPEDPNVFRDQHVNGAETDFFAIIEKETKPEELVEEQVEEEPVVDEPPPPPPVEEPVIEEQPSETVVESKPAKKADGKAKKKK